METTLVFSVLRSLTLVAFLNAVGTMSAWGASTTVTAEFSPDPANPMTNEFKNTTVNAGYCRYFPYVCVANGFFSLHLGPNSAANATIQAHHTDPRKGAMFKIPTDWRTLEVTNTTTGEKEPLDVRISGFSVNQVFPVPAGDISGPGGHETMWTGGAWRYAPDPCRGNYTQMNWARTYMAYWHFPENTGVCAKQARFDIPDFRYQEMSFTYELRTPNPLGMSTGDYIGAINYTVGPGADFDFGDVMIPSDPLSTINFRLKVQHHLKVEIPPGGNKIELVPQGGWQAWLNQGRRPTRLFRDQTFHMSASSRFKMQLECQYAAPGDTCGLEDATGNQVPLQVLVTLPSGITREDDSPVNRQPLRMSGLGTELFRPGIYVDRKPSALHFDIQSADVEQMLSREAATYRGNVTVIWDSGI